MPVIAGASRKYAGLFFDKGGQVFNALHPEFGIVADGVANDRTAIYDFLHAVALVNGIAWFPKASYNVGNLAASELVFDFLGVDGFGIDGHMARFLCTTNTTPSQPKLFFFDNCQHIKLRGLRINDSGTVLTTDWKGAHLFCFVNNSQPIGTINRGYQIRDCVCENGVALLTVSNPGTGRLAGFDIDGHCHAENTYYAMQFQENGDDVRVRGFTTKNCKRNYFAYGVKRHDIDVSIYHDGVAQGANSAILIKRYEQDTQDIKVRASFFGSVAQYQHGITLEQQPTANAPGLIRDVTAEIHIDDTVASPGSMIPFCFRSYLANGTEELTTTANRWDRIRLGGSIGPYVGANGIEIRAQQTTEGALALDQMLQSQTDVSRPHYPGFVMKPAVDREVRTASGNLTLAAQKIIIPLLPINNQSFFLLIRLYAHDNYTSLAVQNAVLREDSVVGYISAGTAAILNTTNRYTHAQGTAPGVTFTAVGSTIEIAFTGALYNNANAFARAEVHYVSRGPWNR